MSAGAIRQQPLISIFNSGQNVSVVLQDMPACTVHTNFTGKVELINTDTGRIIKSVNIDIESSRFFTWDTLKFPYLDWTFTGIYKCRAGSSISLESHRLYIHGKSAVVIFSFPFRQVGMFSIKQCYLRDEKSRAP